MVGFGALVLLVRGRSGFNSIRTRPPGDVGSVLSLCWFAVDRGSTRSGRGRQATWWGSVLSLCWFGQSSSKARSARAATTAAAVTARCRAGPKAHNRQRRVRRSEGASTPRLAAAAVRGHPPVCCVSSSGPRVVRRARSAELMSTGCLARVGVAAVTRGAQNWEPRLVSSRQAELDRAHARVLVRATWPSRLPALG